MKIVCKIYKVCACLFFSFFFFCTLTPFLLFLNIFPLSYVLTQLLFSQKAIFWSGQSHDPHHHNSTWQLVFACVCVCVWLCCHLLVLFLSLFVGFLVSCLFPFFWLGFYHRQTEYPWKLKPWDLVCGSVRDCVTLFSAGLLRSSLWLMGIMTSL